MQLLDEPPPCSAANHHGLQLLGINFKPGEFLVNQCSDIGNSDRFDGQTTPTRNA